MIPPWLQKIATGRAVAIAFLAWMAYSAVLLKWGPYPLLKASILDLPEEDFTPTASETHSKLGQLGEKGRERYLDFQLLDGVNALFVIVAGTLLLTYPLSRVASPRSPLRSLAYLPAAAGVCDLIENSLLVTAVSRHPQWSPAALRVASAATLFKQLSGAVALPLTAFCFAKLGMRVLRARKKKARTSRS